MVFRHFRELMKRVVKLPEPLPPQQFQLQPRCRNRVVLCFLLRKHRRHRERSQIAAEHPCRSAGFIAVRRTGFPRQGKTSPDRSNSVRSARCPNQGGCRQQQRFPQFNQRQIGSMKRDVCRSDRQSVLPEQPKRTVLPQQVGRRGQPDPVPGSGCSDEGRPPPRVIAKDPPDRFGGFRREQHDHNHRHGPLDFHVSSLVFS